MRSSFKEGFAGISKQDNGPAAAMDLRVGLVKGAPIAYACGAVRWVLPTLCVSEHEVDVCEARIDVCN